jgi:predicted phage terminase large subunit-like protein
MSFLPKARKSQKQTVERVKLADGTIQCVHRVYDKQLRFIDSQTFITGFVAGRASGKSYTGALKVLFDARDGWEIMAVSPTYVIAQDTTFPTFCEAASSVGRLIRTKLSPFPRAFFRTEDGGRAEIAFRSGEDPDKLRGPSKPMLWIDEASIAHQDVFKIGVATLRYRGKMGQCLLTFTPRGRQHWTFQEFFTMVDAGEAARLGGEGLQKFGDSWYRQRKNTCLIQAHSSENPFVASEYVDLISGVYTSAMREQELAGKFVDVAGLMFSRENFHLIAPHEISRGAMRVRYWDRAATAGDGCYTAGALLCMPHDARPYKVIIEDVVRGQWHPADRDKVMLQTAQRDAEKYDGEVIIYIEQEGGSGGKEIGQMDVAKLAGFPVFLDVVGGSRTRKRDGINLPGPAKVVRAMGLAAQVEAGNVGICKGAWNEAYLDEATAFPESSYADQVDACSGAFNKLAIHWQGEAQSPERLAPPPGFGSKILEMQSVLALNRKRLV